MSSRKVIIPKGTINPNQTSVIEIPTNLQGSSVVVARNVTGGSGNQSGAANSSGSSGAYTSYSQPGNDSSGAYKGASQFSAGSYSGGNLSPPSSPEYGAMAQYREFRTDVRTEVQSSPLACLQDEEDDPEFEAHIAEQMGMLSNLEFVEYDQLMEDLNNFQRYRRRLEQDLSNMGM